MYAINLEFIEEDKISINKIKFIIIIYLTLKANSFI